MTNYLLGQNLDFVNMLTKQIISNEGGQDEMKKKIKNEIENIKMNKTLKEFRLKYLTVMILGKIGV